MMSLTAAILICVGTLAFGFGILTMISRSIDERSMIPGVIVVAMGAFLFWSAGYGTDKGYGIGDIPMAFVHMAALVLGR